MCSIILMKIQLKKLINEDHLFNHSSKSFITHLLLRWVILSKIIEKCPKNRDHYILCLFNLHMSLLSLASLLYFLRVYHHKRPKCLFRFQGIKRYRLCILPFKILMFGLFGSHILTFPKSKSSILTSLISNSPLMLAASLWAAILVTYWLGFWN